MRFHRKPKLTKRKENVSRDSSSKLSRRGRTKINQQETSPHQKTNGVDANENLAPSEEDLKTVTIPRSLLVNSDMKELGDCNTVKYDYNTK